MAGRIAVVDAENRFLRWEERSVIHQRRLPHRTVHILIFGADGRLLIQRRHRDKDTWAGAWDLSACGHVEESDYSGGPDDDLDAVYADVARREVAEELGVDVELEDLGHFAPQDGVHYEQLRLFRGRSDGPFQLQEEEVEEVRWVSGTDLDALAGAGETLTSVLGVFVDWLRARGEWAE